MINKVENHRAGFVPILGNPNVGKSTLMNILIGEKLSIITPKAQTTRHRIIGIYNDEKCQIVFSDTPGIIEPKYNLHQAMMKYIENSLIDADLIIHMEEINEDKEQIEIVEKIRQTNIPSILVLNKIDQSPTEKVKEKIEKYKKLKIYDEVLAISALKNINIDSLKKIIIDKLPIHPPYFEKDQLSDRPIRFFAAEIIREKIFLNYTQEIPYSCEVKIVEFKEHETLVKIKAEIYVERESQKGILIGHKGEALKKVGIQAREELEFFLGKKVHLETLVKVEKNWRSNLQSLRKFGYIY